MADQAGSSEHSALCLRLMQLFPRVTRGMRRWQDRAAQPLARALDKLTPAEQEAFLKAMDLLETELHQQDAGN